MTLPVRFIIAGSGTALLFFVLAWALVSAGLPPFSGTLLAYATAIVAGYTAQRQWTFRAAHPHSRSFPRYLALQIGCGVLSGLISHVTTNLLGLQPFLMSLTAVIAVSAISFVASALWVFPDANSGTLLIGRNRRSTSRGKSSGSPESGQARASQPSAAQLTHDTAYCPCVPDDRRV